MPQDKQCCDYCGTINETRVDKCQYLNCKCHIPTSPKSDWRENLHRTIQEIMYPKKGTDGKFLMKIPPVIIDAIDAAYTAGLDDREEAFKAGEALGQQNGIRNIGMLRQWLNEKPADRLVTNEDIEHWLNLK